MIECETVFSLVIMAIAGCSALVSDRQLGHARRDVVDLLL
jgi:uncharacterized OsmC-like protein